MIDRVLWIFGVASVSAVIAGSVFLNRMIVCLVGFKHPFNPMRLLGRYVLVEAQRGWLVALILGLIFIPTVDTFLAMLFGVFLSIVLERFEV